MLNPNKAFKCSKPSGVWLCFFDPGLRNFSKFPTEPGLWNFNEFSVDYETPNFSHRQDYEMSMKSQGKFHNILKSQTEAWKFHEMEMAAKGLKRSKRSDFWLSLPWPINDGGAKVVWSVISISVSPCWLHSLQRWFLSKKKFQILTGTTIVCLSYTGIAYPLFPHITTLWD